MVDVKLVDEREAAITAAYNAVTGQDGESWHPDQTLAALNTLWDLASGFRRSAAPEPSSECPQCHRTDGQHKLGCGERFGAEPYGEHRDLTPRGNLVCTGCRVCGCPALGIAPQAAPTDDERGQQFVTDADLDRFEAIATPMYQSTREAAGASKYLVSDLCQWIVRLVAEVRRLRRSEVPEPSAEGYAKFEDWEQEMFRHQPVLSMADGSVAGCQCLDRVFVKGREDWGSHLAAVITARLPGPQGEPSDAEVLAALNSWNGPHVAPGLSWYDTTSVTRMRAALRAAGGAR